MCRRTPSAGLKKENCVLAYIIVYRLDRKDRESHCGFKKAHQLRTPRAMPLASTPIIATVRLAGNRLMWWAIRTWYGNSGPYSGATGFRVRELLPVMSTSNAPISLPTYAYTFYS
jgi:hypothetical protein